MTVLLPNRPVARRTRFPTRLVIGFGARGIVFERFQRGKSTSSGTDNGNPLDFFRPDGGLGCHIEARRLSGEFQTRLPILY